MLQIFKTKIGRLRIIGFLEGISLLILVFVAVPLKYFYHYPEVSKILGPVHGALFVIFVINTVTISIEQNWKFNSLTWKILLASFIPFGNFYIDQKYLKDFEKLA